MYGKSNMETYITMCKIYAAAAAKSLQSRPTLCDPTDGSLPGSPVPGILKARTLDGVAISFSIPSNAVLISNVPLVETFLFYFIEG